MKIKNVLSPINVGGVEVPNRILRTAHGTRFGGGVMSDTLIDYHALRAEGGVGLSILEIMSVHPSSPSGLNSFNADIRGGYVRLIERVRPHGMRLFQQLWHGGHHTAPLDGSPPWSASDIASPRLGVVPIPMSQGMIEEVVEGFCQAAKLCQSVGLDGVEIHAAHGYLIHQFLSPATNYRQDKYGGDLNSRMNLLLEILTAVRASVDTDKFAVGVRLAPDMSEGGLGPEEVLEIALRLERERLIDFVDISQGSYHAFDKMIGGMHEPSGYEIPISRLISRKLSVPTFVIGRVGTLEEADQIIRSGDADLVGMTRATIADPMLVKKTREGRPLEVRPCIACNQGCVGNLLGPEGRMGCVVNPSVGHEAAFGDHHLTHSSSGTRNVVVVGGGPAGLEAARVAAMKGHRVSLYEAQPHLGGALRVAARAPSRHGFQDLIVWLEREVYRLGVSVFHNHYMTADDIEMLDFDDIIIATGSMPRLDGIQLANPGAPLSGIDDSRVISSWDLLSAQVQLNHGEKAVVIDDLGNYEGLSVAEYLLGQGLEVHFVTRHISVAPLSEPALMVEPALRRMHGKKITLHTRMRAVAVKEGGVLIGPVYQLASEAETLLHADRIVLVSANRANRELYDQLVTTASSVQVVGDANSPRQLQVAMREGHRAGAAIG